MTSEVHEASVSIQKDGVKKSAQLYAGCMRFFFLQVI